MKTRAQPPASLKKTTRQPTASRLRKEAAILQEAQAQFAQYGFEGTSLESIGAALGISRHNLLYYYPNKETLYRRLLDDVIDQWLAGMDDLARSDEPEAALRHYIALKLRFSRECPNGVKMFTKEVMAGAPRYSDTISARVTPLLQRVVRRFDQWARQGRVARVNFTHLMFVIWTSTQAYAEQNTQFALLLNKPALSPRDYNNAESLILRLVLNSLTPTPSQPVSGRWPPPST